MNDVLNQLLFGVHQEHFVAAEEFLIMLKEKCSVTDKEWEERQTIRQMEMQASFKALPVLNSDDASDLFNW